MKTRLSKFFKVKNGLRALASLTIFSASMELNAQDRIVLSNGDIMDGIIVEQVPGMHVKLYSDISQDTTVVRLSEIDRIQKLALPEVQTSLASEPETKDLQPAFNNRLWRLYLNGSVGSGDLFVNGFGMNLGYNISRRIQVGAGVNYYSQVLPPVHSYDEINTTIEGNDSKAWGQMLPVTADFRYVAQESRNQRMALILNASAGLNFLLNSEESSSRYGETYWSNGFYAQTGIGFRINLTKETGLLLNVSYQHAAMNRVVQSTGDILYGRNRSNILLTGSVFF